MQPRSQIVDAPTPLVRTSRLSDKLGVELFIKRDDMAGPTLGGNKSRQLEYYFGDALAQGADTILITGAVQSNFSRLAASVAARLGMKAVVQLEDRVADKPPIYRQSGNTLLTKVLGAEVISFPNGEDEEGADAALHSIAEELRKTGHKPYVIHLSEGHPPLGALGYVDAAKEILAQSDDFDTYVVASGSGSTHAGLLAGLRGAQSGARVVGSCVRRPAAAQSSRIRRVIDRLANLYPPAGSVADDDIIVWDGALSPGYGKLGVASRHAIQTMAQYEGLHLDPVYTAKSFAAVLAQIETGEISQGSRVCFVHTGGLAALFAYGDEL